MTEAAVEDGDVDEQTREEEKERGGGDACEEVTRKSVEQGREKNTGKY